MGGFGIKDVSQGGSHAGGSIAEEGLSFPAGLRLQTRWSWEERVGNAVCALAGQGFLGAPGVRKLSPGRSWGERRHLGFSPASPGQLHPKAESQGAWHGSESEGLWAWLLSLHVQGAGCPPVRASPGPRL